MRPRISFVVPCYNLAHLLPECLDSILTQSLRDIEILVMDDCSPDNTAQVVRACRDTRVRHIRNETNLGHLRNYNKGISLAEGDYIWLISADDRLRTANIAARYVAGMDALPRAGYCFCPGVGFDEQGESGLLRYSVCGEADALLEGRTFLRRLLTNNCVLAASGMVRRTCYEKLGLFPTDLPFAGDWYLWCLFALHYDVLYFAEPMVAYRQHPLSMTERLFGRQARTCLNDDLAVLWRIRHEAILLGRGDTGGVATDCIVERATCFISGQYRAADSCPFTLADFESSVAQHAPDQVAARQVRGRVFAAVADRLFSRDEMAQSRRFYQYSLAEMPANLTTWCKLALLSCGGIGTALRQSLRALSASRDERCTAQVRQ